MVVAVISPTYKEQGNIVQLIESVLKQQQSVDPKYEIHLVVSDSHSPDDTSKIALEYAAQNPRVHYLDVVERGIGRGIIEGFRYALDKLDAQILIQIDADLSHPPEVIPKMIEKIEKGYDLVIGSRYIKGGSNNYGPYRKFQSYMGNQFIRFCLGLYDIHEFLTSYRALTRELFLKANLDNVQWQAKTFVFQPTFVYELLQHKPKYIEVPVVFKNRKSGHSKMNTMKYIRDVVVFALKARIKKSKQFVKFLMVGGTGFTINTVMLVLLDKGFHIDEAIAASIGAEIAIVSNFILNNFWTFKHSRVNRKNVIPKFIQFNVSSFGAVLIQYVTITFGKTYITPLLPFNSFWKSEMSYVYYIIAVGIGLIYNYLMYSRVIWKKKISVA